MNKDMLATILVALLFLTMLNTSVAVLKAVGIDVTASAVYGGVDLEVTAPPAEAAPPAAPSAGPSGGPIVKNITTNESEFRLENIPTGFSIYGKSVAANRYAFDTSDSYLFAVEGLVFELNEGAKDFNILFNQVERPKNLPQLSILYQYYNATLTGISQEKFSNIDIDIRVSKDWINEQQINTETISLYRYTVQWERLTTARISEDANYIHYRARTPGFSYFAIAGDRLPGLPPAIAVDIKYVSPLAWLVIIIASINAAILYALVWRKK